MGTRPNDLLIAYCRREQLLQSEFAKKLGMPQPRVNKWLRGRRRIDVDNLLMVAKVTKIPARKLRPDLAKLFLPGRAPRRSRPSRAA